MMKLMIVKSRGATADPPGVRTVTVGAPLYASQYDEITMDRDLYENLDDYGREWLETALLRLKPDEVPKPVHNWRLVDGDE